MIKRRCRVCGKSWNCKGDEVCKKRKKKGNFGVYCNCNACTTPPHPACVEVKEWRIA